MAWRHGGRRYTDPVDIDDLAITIQADGPAVQFRAPLTVHDLAPGKTFVMRGLLVDPLLLEPACIVDNNQGAVRFEDCTFVSFGLNGNGATVRFSDAVVFVRCEFEGAPGPDSCEDCAPFGIGPGPGGGGCFIRHATVAFYDCTLTGGEGGADIDAEGYTGAMGGPGLESVGGDVFLSGGTISGGQGGRGGCDFTPVYGWTTCADGGRGGHGALARGDCQVVLQGDPPLAGPGGPAGNCGNCGLVASDGPNGEVIKLEDTASVMTFPNRPRLFDASF